MAATAKVLNGTGPDANIIVAVKLMCKASIFYLGYKSANESFKMFEEGIEDFTKELRKLRIVEEEKRDILSHSLNVTKKKPATTVGAPSWFQILTDLNKSTVGGTEYKNSIISKSLVGKMMAESIGMRIDNAVLSLNPFYIVFLCKILPKATNCDILKLMEILGEEVGTKG